MPKVRGTIKEKKKRLLERLSPESLRDGVFRTTEMGDHLDTRTIDEIYNRYVSFYNSWIKDDLEKFLK